MKKLCTALLAMLAAGTAWSQTVPGVALQTVATGFSTPVDLQNAGDNRMFVVEKPGLIIAWDPATGSKDTFLNIIDRVLSAGSEQGLLGLAFDADYANTGRFYVNYTTLDSTGDSSGVTHISRFLVNANDPNHADAGSEEILIMQDQPFQNHNGGWLAFGPDGYLYIALGDGGSGGDPFDNAMNLGTLLGKILRIDVSAPVGYDIPAGNPFISVAGALPEIYHYGLRNPFRNSFDMETGDLWIADVGQEMWEEINYLPSGTGGGLNFGWDCYEAFTSYESNDCPLDDSLTFPVYAYNHDVSTGDCAVLGGYVYRGSAIPALYGHYIFTDLCSGRVRMLTQDSTSWSAAELTNGDNFAHTSFGMDINGELYITQLNGDIVMLVDTSCTPVAALLSDDTIETCDAVLLQALEAPNLTYQWFNDTGAIADATGSSVTVSAFGSYYVVVTDTTCGGSDTSDAVVLIPGVLNFDLSITNNGCLDTAAGVISISVLNGVPPYTFAWSNGATSDTLEDLISGVYSVTISDANGCSASADALVQTDPGFTITLLATNTSCNANTGKVGLTVDGGTAPFTYTWNNGAQTEDIDSLPAGEYVVTVVDANGCSVVDTATVIVNPAISTNILGDTSVCGIVSTLLTVDAIGVSYLWNTGDTTSTIFVSAGLYSVTVFDTSGCAIATGEETVTAYELPSLLFNVTNATAGQSNGSVDLTVTGGDAPYEFVWNNGITDEDLTNVASGVYDVTVTTGAGCTTTGSVTVGADSVAVCPMPTDLVVTNVTNNTADITWSDATGAIQYIVNYGPVADSSMWLTVGADTNTISFFTLESGTAYEVHVYTVCADSSVSDFASVTFTTNEDTVAVCPAPTNIAANNITTTGADITWDAVPGALQYIVNYGPTGDTSAWVTLGVATNALTLFTLESNTEYELHVFTVCADSNVSTDYAITTFTTDEVITGCNLTVNIGHADATCYGLKTGSAIAAPVGGTGPYTYLWSNGRTQSSLPKLAAGTYSVTVTDAAGCTAVATVSISQPAPILAYQLSTQTCPSQCTGTASVFWVSGGIQPLSYLWSNGETTTTITGLCAGIYWVTITDASGCNKIVGSSVSANPSACGASGSQRDGDDYTNALTLYPNPTDANLNIWLPAYEGTAQVQVYNAMGQLVTTVSVGGIRSATLDVSQLATGVYHLQFLNNGLVETIKFIKQ